MYTKNNKVLSLQKKEDFITELKLVNVYNLEGNRLMYNR